MKTYLVETSETIHEVKAKTGKAARHEVWQKIQQKKN